MRKVKGWISVLGLFVVLTSCGDGGLDIDINNSINGSWLLLETCRNGACTSPDPGQEITIEFGENSLLERENGTVIGSANFIVATVDNSDGVTTYQLIVNDDTWVIIVEDDALELNTNILIRRYSRQ